MSEMETADDLIITSASQSAGKRLRVRLGECFFRRWYVFLIPIVLLAVLGVMQAKDLAKSYRAVGKVNVASSTLLTDITSVNTPSFGYETPAGKTARDLNQRLGTDTFATEVAMNAGFSGAPSSSGVFTPRPAACVGLGQRPRRQRPRDRRHHGRPGAVQGAGRLDDLDLHQLRPHRRDGRRDRGAEVPPGAVGDGEREA